jgi:hypothetical protein
MRRRNLRVTGRRRTDRELVRYARLSHRTTLAYTIFTGLILVGMGFTIYQQKGFNKKQLELYELSTAPLVFVELDSLRQTGDYNVFLPTEKCGHFTSCGRQDCLPNNTGEGESVPRGNRCRSDGRRFPRHLDYFAVNTTVQT